MADMNICNFIGRMSNEPKIIKRGCFFSLETKKKSVDRNGIAQSRTTYVDFVAFDKYAEVIAQKGKIGLTMHITGEYSVYQDKEKGTKRHSFIVKKFEFLDPYELISKKPIDSAQNMSNIDDDVPY